MDKRQVHIRDIEGKLLYTRLYDDGHGPLTFDGGIGFIDRLDLQRYRWQVLDGWPSTQNARHQYIEIDGETVELEQHDEACSRDG